MTFMWSGNGRQGHQDSKYNRQLEHVQFFASSIRSNAGVDWRDLWLTDPLLDSWSLSNWQSFVKGRSLLKHLDASGPVASRELLSTAAQKIFLVLPSAPRKMPETLFIDPDTNLTPRNSRPDEPPKASFSSGTEPALDRGPGSH